MPKLVMIRPVQELTGVSGHGHPSAFNTTGKPEFDERIKQLVKDWGHARSPELIEEMIATALRMSDDEIGEADLKLFNRSLKELRYSSKVFAPYHSLRKVAVFGSARTPPEVPEYQCAVEFSRKMVLHNYMVLTGGGDGIMGAANEGAGREHSFGLNIRLPFEQRANKWIDGDSKLLNFNYFFTRKLVFVKETHAVALFPGGFGTMDEGFECLTLMQTGKARIIPVVLVNKPGGRYWETWLEFMAKYLLNLGLVSVDDFNLFKITDNVDAAVDEILKFYRNYHSSRWVGHKLVFRLHHRIIPAAIEKIENDFVDLLQGEKIIQGKALPAESNEPVLSALPRLILAPHRRNFGRLRLLIDAVNDAEQL
ncbi:MAG TPA: LOG family protein [Chthoniobacterales bacterium]